MSIPLKDIKIDTAMKVVGFLSNRLTLRGTEIALYDYADYNESYLGNKSIIITQRYDKVKHLQDTDSLAYDKFTERFQIEYYDHREDIDEVVVRCEITHLYIIKYGVNDGLVSSKCKNLIHCVFNTTQPHGDVYAAVSNTVNVLHHTDVPVVPHLIRVNNTLDNYRQELQIPENCIVFGRYGGADSFDIPFVKECILKIVESRSDIYFLFMNTDPFLTHPCVIYMPGATVSYVKRKFINTTDALLHARMSGETFGLTCGEFAICSKPVITYGNSLERNHIEILKDKGVLYYDFDSIHKILTDFTVGKYDMTNNGYMQYDYKYVMDIFDSVYLKILN